MSEIKRYDLATDGLSDWIAEIPDGDYIKTSDLQPDSIQAAIESLQFLAHEKLVPTDYALEHEAAIAHLQALLEVAKK